MKSRVPVFLAYLQSARQYSVHTVAAYRRDLADFEHFLIQEQKSSAKAEDISDDDVRGYLRALTKRKLSPRTVARRLASLRAFQKYLLRRGVRGVQIGPELKGPRIPKRLPGVLSKEELATLLDQTDWENHRHGHPGSSYSGIVLQHRNTTFGIDSLCGSRIFIWTRE